MVGASDIQLSASKSELNILLFILYRHKYSVIATGSRPHASVIFYIFYVCMPLFFYLMSLGKIAKLNPLRKKMSFHAGKARMFLEMISGSPRDFLLSGKLKWSKAVITNLHLWAVMIL